MPRNNHGHGNNNNTSESDLCPTTDGCSQERRPCIVCPPKEYKEKYDSSSSDSSCPDFSELACDNPKICCEKKNNCKKSKKHNKPCNLKKSDDSSSSASNDDHWGKWGSPQAWGGGGCGAGISCGGCGNCKSCNFRKCPDYSVSSVISGLGGSETSDCPDFDELACNEKKKCCNLQNPCKKHRPGRGKGKKFVVSFCNKSGHQWCDYNNGHDAIKINGKVGPVLHLYRGATYYFCVEQDVPPGAEARHMFLLTNSPSGGPNSRPIPGSFQPIGRGTVTFKVTNQTPKYFFYQCSRHSYEGGLVIVHDN